MAVREGFEPSKPYDLHTFQACSFGHSDTSPYYFQLQCFGIFKMPSPACGSGGHSTQNSVERQFLRSVCPTTAVLTMTGESRN